MTCLEGPVQRNEGLKSPWNSRTKMRPGMKSENQRPCSAKGFRVPLQMPKDRILIICTAMEVWYESLTD